MNTEKIAHCLQILRLQVCSVPHVQCFIFLKRQKSGPLSHLAAIGCHQRTAVPAGQGTCVPACYKTSQPSSPTPPESLLCGTCSAPVSVCVYSPTLSSLCAVSVESNPSSPLSIQAMETLISPNYFFHQTVLSPLPALHMLFVAALLAKIRM